MANVFQTNREINLRYDLKGSTYGRITKSQYNVTLFSSLSSDPGVAKKDLNFIENKEKIILPPGIADLTLEVLEKDAKFFEDNGIIDYSLLLGIHHVNPEEDCNESNSIS